MNTTVLFHRRVLFIAPHSFILGLLITKLNALKHLMFTIFQNDNPNKNLNNVYNSSEDTVLQDSFTPALGKECSITAH